MRPAIVLVHGALAESASRTATSLALQRFMAKRARARRTLEIPGASHATAVSHSGETADLILEAAALPAAA